MTREMYDSSPKERESPEEQEEEENRKRTPKGNKSEDEFMRDKIRL